MQNEKKTNTLKYQKCAEKSIKNTKQYPKHITNARNTDTQNYNKKYDNTRIQEIQQYKKIKIQQKSKNIQK